MFVRDVAIPQQEWMYLRSTSSVSRINMGVSNSLMPLTERLMSVLESVASSAPSTSWKMLKKESSIHQTNADVLQQHQYQCLPTSMPPNIFKKSSSSSYQCLMVPVSHNSPKAKVFFWTKVLGKPLLTTGQKRFRWSKVFFDLRNKHKGQTF